MKIRDAMILMNIPPTALRAPWMDGLDKTDRMIVAEMVASSFGCTINNGYKFLELREPNADQVQRILRATTLADIDDAIEDVYLNGKERLYDIAWTKGISKSNQMKIARKVADATGKRRMKAYQLLQKSHITPDEAYEVLVAKTEAKVNETLQSVFMRNESRAAKTQ
jgi:hypothetical protein